MQTAQFLGSWKLLSWRISAADGDWHHPLGPDADGLLVYAPDGYMFAALMGGGPSRLPRQRPLERECL